MRTCTPHLSKRSYYPPKFLKSVKLQYLQHLGNNPFQIKTHNSPTISNVQSVMPATINIFNTLFSCKVFILCVFNGTFHLTTDTFGIILLVCNIHCYEVSVGLLAFLSS